MSSKFIKAKAASRFESDTTGLRGGRGAEDFAFGSTTPPKSKDGRKDSGAGAVIGCGRAMKGSLNDFSNRCRRLTYIV